ncbi:unnamed protein product, partial [Ceratitis capitata]
GERDKKNVLNVLCLGLVAGTLKTIAINRMKQHSYIMTFLNTLHVTGAIGTRIDLCQAVAVSLDPSNPGANKI